MKNNNYIHHAPYLTKSIAYYDHDFWCTSVKWYLQVFFFSFLNFHFLGCLEGKRVKSSLKGKTTTTSVMCHMSGKRIAYDHDFWYTCVKWYLFSFFFIYFKFWFFRLLGSKSAKNSPKWKITVTSVMGHISGAVSHMIMSFDTLV